MDLVVGGDCRGGCFVVEMRGGHPGGARETYPDLTLFSEAQKPGFFFNFSGFSGSPGEKKGSAGIPMTYVIFPSSKI